jgi:hypothetical protein
MIGTRIGAWCLRRGGGIFRVSVLPDKNFAQTGFIMHFGLEECADGLLQQK